jgi:exonuclease SbcD
VFPNVCELVYERNERALGIRSLDGTNSKMANPLDVVGEFVEFVRDECMTDGESDVVATALHDIRRGEDAA